MRDTKRNCVLYQFTFVSLFQRATAVSAVFLLVTLSTGRPLHLPVSAKIMLIRVHLSHHFLLLVLSLLAFASAPTATVRSISLCVVGFHLSPLSHVLNVLSRARDYPYHVSGVKI